MTGQNGKMSILILRRLSRDIGILFNIIKFIKLSTSLAILQRFLDSIFRDNFIVLISVVSLFLFKLLIISCKVTHTHTHKYFGKRILFVKFLAEVYIFA